MNERSKPAFSRMDAIRTAWVDTEVEPVFVTAQMDMAYLLAEYEAVRDEWITLDDEYDHLQERFETLREAGEALAQGLRDYLHAEQGIITFGLNEEYANRLLDEWKTAKGNINADQRS